MLAEKHCRQTQVAEFRNLLPVVKDIALVLDEESHGAGCKISKGVGTTTHV